MTPNDPTAGDTFHFEMATADGSLEGFYDAFDDSPVSECMPMAHRLAVKLAFDEIVSNIIKYAGGGDYHVIVRLSFHPERGLRMVLKDDSPEFDPWNAPLKAGLGRETKDDDLEHIEVGGRGIFMIRQMMDSLSHTVENGWNCNILEKNI